MYLPPELDLALLDDVDRLGPEQASLPECQDNETGAPINGAEFRVILKLRTVGLSQGSAIHSEPCPVVIGMRINLQAVKVPGNDRLPRLHHVVIGSMNA